eukprot:GHVO01057792.1.p2 GENE.GHVO01057792.1~~GHVO01057792.1.p2  ORF type:complete len:104 (-),score=11.34 GHVO01057792.1:219-530(-)
MLSYKMAKCTDRQSGPFRRKSEEKSPVPSRFPFFIAFSNANESFLCAFNPPSTTPRFNASCAYGSSKANVRDKETVEVEQGHRMKGMIINERAVYVAFKTNPA